MASLQQRKVKGRKYWYIVESRRVNGKPRPIVLEYLGTAERLLERLSQVSKEVKLKSYEFGDVAALLTMAQKLNIVEIINKYIYSTRKGFAQKPIRNNLTAGATYLLAAIGRSCMMTSKRGWYEWAKGTCLEYLLSVGLSKVSSQHFWDLMDALPEENIEKAEREILTRVLTEFDLQSDTLFYDTTNFYTFIATTNKRNTLAQRGKNKQKRHDLRQVGLALVVSKQDHIPLFHHSYAGNLHDARVFEKVINNIVRRMKQLGLNMRGHTVVLDRGNNSKANLKTLEGLELYYVGALSPCNHKELSNRALEKLSNKTIGENSSNVYKIQTEIWGRQTTVLFFISDLLKAGQIRGLEASLAKVEKHLTQLQDKLSEPQSNKRKRKQITAQINRIVQSKKAEALIDWQLKWKSKGRYELSFERKEDQIAKLKQKYGLRMIMTNRHEWEADQIIKAYYGQSEVEQAFKELKNPYHLTIKPQYHWTDQKIRVHHFICVLAYLLSSLLYRQVRIKTDYEGSMSRMLNQLKNIRMGSVLNKNGAHGKITAQYKIEEMSTEEKTIFEALELQNILRKKVKIKGVGVYN